MRILLTGGTGFVGSHLALSLLENGHDVVIFDSLINSSYNVINSIKAFFVGIELDDKIKIINGDIRDKSLLDNIFSESILEGKPIQSVIHLAGLKSVSESVINPLHYWEVNVYGTLNLLKSMKDNQCYSIVFSSSATVYGVKGSVPLTEDLKVAPINPYGRTKVAIENILQDIFNANKTWRICSLRYFNPVGAHPSGLIGEDPIGIPNNLFPYLAQVAIGKRKYLNVFGDNWSTKDGSGVRDYIHIVDLVEGHIAALEFLQTKDSCYEAINLGSGSGYSVFEIINQFELTTGIQIPYKIAAKRDGDIAISLADISKAKKLLGWSPTKSLHQICKDVWNWQCKNPDGFTL